MPPTIKNIKISLQHKSKIYQLTSTIKILCDVFTDTSSSLDKRI